MRAGLRIERVGTEVVVLDAQRAVVHRLTGLAAELTRRIADGAGVVPGGDGVEGRRVIEALGRAGIVSGPFPRRRMIEGAAVGATLGILTLPLPRAAVAATGGGASVSGASDASTDGTLVLTAGLPIEGHAFRTFASSGRFEVEGSGTLEVAVLVVGGGGGGGRDSGGGGAGAAIGVFTASLGAGGFAVTVGQGGTSGVAGAASTFEGVGTAGGGGAGGPGMTGGKGGNTPAPSAGGSGNEAYDGAYGVFGRGGGGAGAGGDGVNGGATSLAGSGGVDFALSGFFGATTAIFCGGGGGGGSEFATGGSGRGSAGSGGSGATAVGGDATGYGAGGGGAAGDADGGRGSDGIVIVRYRTG